MNYSKLYDALIEKARSENREKLQKGDPSYRYYERHHVIPKCLGGTWSKNNLVLLTAREHFLCHWILYKSTPSELKLAYAFSRMCCGNRHSSARKVNSCLFKYAREASAVAQSIMHKGTKYSEEHKKKLSVAQLQSSRHFSRGKHLTEEHKRKIGNANKISLKGKESWNKGKSLTEDTRRKLSAAHQGQVPWNKGTAHSEEAKARMKKSHEASIICEYCGKKVNKTAYTRFHGENCKLKS